MLKVIQYTLTYIHWIYFITMQFPILVALGHSTQLDSIQLLQRLLTQCSSEFQDLPKIC